MARKFAEIEAKMHLQSLARAKSRAKEMMTEMLLSGVRKSVGLTQEEVALALGIKQPTLSRLESQEDMQISTLNRLIQALRRRTRNHRPHAGRRFHLTQFQDVA